MLLLTRYILSVASYGNFDVAVILTLHAAKGIRQKTRASLGEIIVANGTLLQRVSELTAYEATGQTCSVTDQQMNTCSKSPREISGINSFHFLTEAG